MFTRELDEDEVKIIRKVEAFIRDKHASLQGHDYTHVLAVARYAIKIARRIPEPVGPFIVICGALFHDIGRVVANTGRLHGLQGASITNEFLKAMEIERDVRKNIVSIVVRHTETSMLPPLTVEEKIVFDADDLDRLGLLGMLRGMMVGAVNLSMEEIIENRLRKRQKDFEKLHFEASRELGMELYRETLQLIEFIQNSLKQRCWEVSELDLPIAGPSSS